MLLLTEKQLLGLMRAPVSANMRPVELGERLLFAKSLRLGLAVAQEEVGDNTSMGDRSREEHHSVPDVPWEAEPRGSSAKVDVVGWDALEAVEVDVVGGSSVIGEEEDPVAEAGIRQLHPVPRFLGVKGINLSADSAGNLRSRRARGASLN